VFIELTPTHVARPPRIGVFDSGVGGLSVLRELRREWPEARLLYVADAGHAPYGERSGGHIHARSRAVASHLIDDGVSIVVIACNTATAVAAQSLRETWPQTPFIGVEPGIKPALAATRNGRVGVMATRSTLNSDKFKRLVSTLAPGEPLHLRACDGLAAAIEQGAAGMHDVRSLIERHCRPLSEAGVDTVVLGCTHYVFARQQIQAALGPDVRIIDTTLAVAQQVARIGRPAGSVACMGTRTAPTLLLQTTGNAEHLGRVASAWLGETVEAAHITV